MLEAASQTAMADDYKLQVMLSIRHALIQLALLFES